MSAYDDVSKALDDSGVSPGANRPIKPSRCDTCGGDKWIVVRLPSPVTTLWMQERGLQASTTSFHEESAPCYVCNRTAYDSIRGMDAALAQQLHTA